MAFKHGNHTLIDLDSGNDTKITSAAGQDIVFYPDQHIWIKQGTKLIFEGTVPDDFEAKLQATAVTADRDIILPDEDGTLATQAYVTSAVSGGALSNTDALAEGSTNLYYTDARFDTRLATKTTDDLAEGTNNLYYTDARVQAVSMNALSEDTTPELSGDLITAGNRITHASSGTVSMMDFTKTLFSEANHTVLSSVKSINLFLDSNGGDTGQAFRIYNNVDPDGTVTENTHIFKVAETGDVTVTGNLQVDGSQVDFTNLPTSDPAVAGRLWNDSGTVKISAG